MMQSDLPHTLLPPSDKKEGTKVTDDVVRKQEEAIRKARERRRQQAAKPKDTYTMDELFNS